MCTLLSGVGTVTPIWLENYTCYPVHVIITKMVITDADTRYRSGDEWSIMIQFSWTIWHRWTTFCITTMNNPNIQVNIPKLHHKQHHTTAKQQCSMSIYINNQQCGKKNWKCQMKKYQNFTNPYISARHTSNSKLKSSFYQNYSIFLQALHRCTITNITNSLNEFMIIKPNTQQSNFWSLEYPQCNFFTRISTSQKQWSLQMLFHCKNFSVSEKSQS